MDRTYVVGHVNPDTDSIASALGYAWLLRGRRGLDIAMLMATDVVDNSSRLVLVNAPPSLDDLPYPRQPDGIRLAVDIVSRKKQLLPAVLGLLEM